MNLDGVEYYYIRNGQNDIIGLYDEAGVQVAAYSYDTWGKLIGIRDQNGNDITKDDTNVGNKNPYRYRGYRYDDEVGLYYLQSRYYNQEWGRFVNADDINILTAQDELLGKNLFAYCTNNPVNFSDDIGYWKIPNWAKVTIGAIAIGVAVATTVATGGAALPALLGALQVASTSAAIGAGIGAGINGASSLIRGGSINDIGKSMLKGAVDGAADGFMWGGVGAAAETVMSKVASKVIFKGNDGYGYKVGKKVEVMYKNPNKGGGTLFSIKSSKSRFRLDLDPFDGFHGHWGTGKAAKSIHRSLAPWSFGKLKKFW
jgi:RHS repeat-associated protein